MRLIKMLGLAAVAAMAAMAFVGASTASADTENIVLCEKAELECAKPFPNPTTIVGHAENPKLLSSIGTVKCEKSLAEVTLLNELATSLTGHLLALSFEGDCKLVNTACLITVESLGLMVFTKIGALEASVKSTGGTKVRVQCGKFIDCKYAGEPLLKVHSTEAGATKLLANETELKEGTGFLCPKTSKWDADYTALGTMYIES